MEKMLHAASWADARTVYIDGTSPLILPNLVKPLGAGVAPTIYPVKDTTGTVHLLATVDLPAGSVLALGQIGAWIV